MKVLDYVEWEDGSAQVGLDLSEDEKIALIEIGFVKLLTEMIEREEKKNDTGSS